jgi:hypothetical protein
VEQAIQQELILVLVHLWLLGVVRLEKGHNFTEMVLIQVQLLPLVERGELTHVVEVTLLHVLMILEVLLGMLVKMMVCLEPQQEEKHHLVVGEVQCLPTTVELHNTVVMVELVGLNKFGQE